jgi:hypothetical protein
MVNLKEPALATTPREPNSELHEEFRTLTTLLSLVASFSRNGRLKYLDGSGRQRGNFALNAIATILTRDVEVLAVAADKDVNRPGQLVKASFVVAAQPREIWEEPGSLDTEANRWQRILSTGLGGENKDIPCSLIPTGQSHWPSVLLQEWSGLNIG